MQTANPNKTLKLRCLAIDDEPFALKLIADDISKVPFLELMATCSSPFEAQEHLKTSSIDLLFLDIQMPTMTGLEFLRSLENPPMVILTTAYEKYALEGFDLSVVDYLMKPIPFYRFKKAVDKAHELFILKRSDKNSTERPSFFVRAEYKEIKVYLDDVLYVEGLKDYVKIFLQSQPRPILTRLNLKAMETKLPMEQFCRIHNSFIVSMSRIESFQKSQVFLGQKSIPIGEKYATDFLKKYKAGT